MQEIRMKQMSRFQMIKESRNLYDEKVERVRMQHYATTAKKEIQKMSEGLNRYSRVDVRRERASSDLKDF
jgi:hypothetical protein